MKRRVLYVACTALSAFGVGLLCARLFAGSTPSWFVEYGDIIASPLLLTASIVCFIRACPGKMGPRRGILYKALMLSLSGGLFYAGCLALGLAGVISSHQ